MNKGRKFPEQADSQSSNSSPELNPWWVVGFCDGESTFGIKNLTPYFQIPQHEKSHLVMYKLGKYFPNSSYKKDGPPTRPLGRVGGNVEIDKRA